MDYTAIEAAPLLGLAPSSVRVLIRRKKIAAVKRGRDWFISQEEIDRYNRERHKRGPLPGSTWSDETRRAHAARRKQ